MSLLRWCSLFRLGSRSWTSGASHCRSSCGGQTDKLSCLEKLYIRGGMLSGLGEDGGWTVKVLRVRFLKHLNYYWANMHDVYRKLEIMEGEFG